MKPLARWTIGKANSLGEETLLQSVKRFRKIYPEFDLVICYNNLNQNQIQKLKQLNVKLYEQNSKDSVYPLESVNSSPGWKYSMPGWGWKIAPPRLRIFSHELWIDNDLIIFERLPSIDKWLTTNKSLICEGRSRAYGIFEEDIPEDKVFCAGLFGLPPNYDFAKKIEQCCVKLKESPLGYYNEQGITTLAVLDNDPVVAPLSEVCIVKVLQKPYAKAMHFIGVNRTNDHQAWKDYKCYLMM